MSNFTPIKILRSLVYNKRPQASGPNALLDGQPAVNFNADQPGLFFKDSENELFKVGPVAVGPVEPNSPLDPNLPGDGSLCLGETWLDTSAEDGPTYKIWDGSAWVKAEPIVYARALIDDTTPATTFPEGTMWWNSSNGLTYILYQEAWIQMGSTPVSIIP